MYKHKSFLAVIPARGGSKGIPKKNIVYINGKPLIQFTIDEAKKSNYLDRIIVSTDDPEIARIAKNCGADVPFIRPVEISGDNSKTIDTIIHVKNKLEERGERYDYFVVLQPTQPLRKSWHIDEAIESIVNENQDNLVSVSLVKEHPILMRTINSDGKLENIMNMSSTVRRQDFPKIYKVNGAIYINKNDEKLNKSTSLNDNKFAYIMDPKYDMDVDEPFDLEVLKLKLSGEEYNN